jgi:uncharacterized protein with beta-barrel porin domain
MTGIFGIVVSDGTVNNSGTIFSPTGLFGGGYGITADTNLSVTNNAGASITASINTIQAGSVFLVNSGTIGPADPRVFLIFPSSGVFASLDATVINNGSGIISHRDFAIQSAGSVNVTNSGNIFSTGHALVSGGFVHPDSTAISAGTRATVVNNAGGTISGVGFGITAGGGGSTIFNAGSISGATAIRFGGTGNTLTLASSSVIGGNVLGTGSDTFQLGGTGAGTFDLSSLGPAAQYRGFSTFNKVDGSTWTLTGTGTYSGATNVNSGILGVNGSLGNSALTVNAGGTLGGTGSVGSTTINGGTLAPGNSIGLLTVQGSLAFTAASSYMVEVSPANADRTNVTGTATLDGAAVNVSFAAGTYINKQYTIINATGGVTGIFGSVTANGPSGFKTSLSYDANNVFLNLDIALAQYTGLNGNQQNVANALSNFFNRTGGIPAVFGGLTPAGLTQASGELATASQQTTFDAMNLFMGLLTDPFVAGRGDPVTASAVPPQFAEQENATSAYAANGKERSNSERDAYAAVYRKALPPAADPFLQRWSVWAGGYGGSQTTDGNAVLGSNTTTSRIGGVVVGADYRFSPYTLAGFALAGGGTNFSVNGLGSGRSDLFQAGAFVRHTVGPAYISAALAYGWQDITTDRTVTIAGADLLRANFNANAFSGRVEGGYRFVTPWMAMGVTPYAAGQFTTFGLPGYAEQAIAGASTFALTYAAKDVTASRSELGVRTDKSFAMQNGIFTLRGRAAWAHDFNPDRNFAATFQTLPGASFVVNGAAQASDAALVTGSAEMKWLNGFSLAATFEGEFSNVTASYAGKGVVRYAW